MKKYSLILVTLLLFGLVLPTIPFATTNYGNEGIADHGLIENTSLSASGESAATVIKVSDDVPVAENTPNTNWDDDSGGFVLDCSNASGYLTRSWLKFNLTHLQGNIQFTRATVNLFTVSGSGSVDFPRGIYFSENDTWTEETITWNNQPAYSAVPSAVIDSPASPDMFDVGFRYEWEITTEVVQTLEENGILTLVLAFADEDSTSESNLGFASREHGIIAGDSGFNVIPYISLEYSVPSTTDLLVDGLSESPQIDYIRNSNPEFSWTFNDTDPDDFQRNHELEVWNNSNFDDTQLMQDKNSEITVVHDTGGVGVSIPDVFYNPFESRFQFKWPSSMISRSGVVDKLFLEMDLLTGITTYNDLAIYMLSVADSSDLTTDFQANYDGRTPIQVLNRSEFTAITENGFMVLDIENTFIVHSNLNLIVELRHTGASGTAIRSNYTNSGGSIAFRTDSYSHTTADVTATRTHGLKLELVSHDVYSGGTSTNSIPFGLSVGESGRFQFKYNRSLINDEGIIDKILFPAGQTGDVTYENFSVYLVETPLEGELSHPDMDSNYAGATPTLVLSTDEYVVRDVAGVLVIDVDDLFFYSNTTDLMIEIRFDSLVSGNQRAMFTNGAGGYRAFNSTSYYGEDIATFNMVLEFINEANPVVYTGSPLVNATTYYWRVRTCDNLGMWSDWETASFKYEVLTSQPSWSNLVLSGTPLELGESMTFSIDVTHLTGISQVQLEYEGTNHSMSNIGDTFSYTWIPGSAGDVLWTIYMEPQSGVVSSTTESFEVVDTTAPTWNPPPADKVLMFGEDLSYQITATDLSGIASWTINDDNFQIVDGLVTNLDPLELGGYHLNVTVTDNEGNSRSATFIVAVIALTTTTTTSTNTTTTSTQPIPIDGLYLVIIALIGVVVVLVLVIVIQSRKT